MGICVKDFDDSPFFPECGLLLMHLFIIYLYNRIYGLYSFSFIFHVGYIMLLA